tara:strand:- start:351 stop:1475 length:1125 start_codon:yes stop_codon:yes gene_type:complete
MAAVFPLDTSKPWVFNGVTYEYDASEDRWFVVSTVATDQVVDSISDNKSQIDVLDTIIDQEIDNRTALLNAAAAKNNQQDAAILELDARVDAIGATAGILEFKGSYRYVLEKSQSACDAALRVALEEGMDQYEAMRAHTDCVGAIGDPLEPGTFTSIGTLDQSLTEELVIATSDIDGTSYDWENLLESGDYIEVVEQSQQDTALYEVVADPIRSGTEERIRVKHIKETGAGDGHFNLQEVSEIRVIKQSLGLDLVEADKRYQQRPYTVEFSNTAPTEGQAEDKVLTNGELWYDTQNLQLFVWNNNAWVTAASPLSQDIVISGALADIQALKSKPDITSSTTAPADPTQGDLWFNPSTLKFAFYTAGAWINPDQS